MLPKSPRLRRILAAYTVNQLGNWFGYIALSVAVYDHTHSAIAVAGLFIAARFLPALLVPALVARAEASPRRGELSRLYIAEGLTAAALAVLLWHFWLPAILILVAIDGTAGMAANALLRAEAARTDPSEVAAGSLADREDTGEIAAREANAALNVAYTFGVAVGPAIAGVVVATAGGSTALLADAATFLICGALLWRVRAHIPEASPSVRSRIKQAWVYLRGARQLRQILATQAIAMVFFTSIQPVEVLYAKASLHAGDGGFGLLLAVWGMGQLIGSAIFARSVRRPLGPMLTGGTLAVGLAYIGYAVAPSLLVACIAAVIGGVGNGVQWASLISSVQQLTPSDLHGRLMGAVESMGALCPALGFALGGAIATLSSPRTAFLLAGIAATLITGLFARVSLHGLAAVHSPEDSASSPEGSLIAPGSSLVAEPGTAPSMTTQAP